MTAFAEKESVTGAGISIVYNPGTRLERIERELEVI